MFEPEAVEKFFEEHVLPPATSEQEVLDFDALDYAHNKEMTEGEAFFLFRASQNRKKVMLEGFNDTTGFGMLMKDFLSIIEKIGFAKVLEVPFVGRDNAQETFCLFWHNDGLLLKTDTFTWYDGAQNCDSADVYFNFLPNNQERLWDGLNNLSGGFEESSVGYVCPGNMDVREGMKYHLQQMRAHGKFLNPWKKQGHLWLLHHGDTQGKQYGEVDYAGITKQRIAMLPKEIQEAIRGE